MKMLFLFFISLNISHAADCQLSDISTVITVEDKTWTTSDQDFLASTLCSISQFTGVASIGEIWINQTNMAFESRGRLALTPRFKPASAPPGFKKSIETTSAIWGHEYSHAVLKHRLLTRHPEWLKMLMRSGERELLNENILKCHRQLPICPDLRRLIRQTENFWESGEEEQTYGFFKIFIPYDELFADAMVVMAKNNPSAVYEAFINPESDEEYNHQLRDFALPHLITTETNSPHGFMAYSRYWIWENLIKSHQYSKSAIVDALELAIEQQVEKRFKAGEVDTTSPEVNSEFIRNLKAI